MRTVDWQDEAVVLIDQKVLPWKLEQVALRDYRAVAAAITDMTVRGAPAIGATAAYGLALAARQSQASTMAELIADLQQAAQVLKDARPTAVNLAWAVDQLLALATADRYSTPDALRAAMLAAAQRIADDDVIANQKMGMYGAALITEGSTVLHHCNTGALATVDHGTALGVIRSAHEQGTAFHVLLDETRPRLQGSRLSAWELERLGVSYDIIADTAAGYYMRRGEVSMAIVGADRIAANGDVANKIGTYQVAVLAHAHGIPFYVAAPTSTVDLSLPDGDHIPIEQRDKDEVLAPYGCELAPAHFRARNPAFDITPNEYITGIITECGIARPDYQTSLRAMVNAGQGVS
ncbi:MAG: S-methyl-5-thioribose-1-phosphate isomerase [Phototrophicaceae bacterium]